MNSLLPLLASCDIIHQALGWDRVSFTLELARMHLLGERINCLFMSTHLSPGDSGGLAHLGFALTPL